MAAPAECMSRPWRAKERILRFFMRRCTPCGLMAQELNAYHLPSLCHLIVTGQSVDTGPDDAQKTFVEVFGASLEVNRSQRVGGNRRQSPSLLRREATRLSLVMHG